MIGEAFSRVDGIEKVMGKATYATDFPVNNVAYGYLIKSTIAAGKIIAADTGKAEKSGGVIAIITAENALKLKPGKGLRGGSYLQNPDIHFFGENVGIVVAETFEEARTAARLVEIKYEKSAPKVDFEKEIKSAQQPKADDRKPAVKGDFAANFQNAEYKIDALYETPVEHHNPMAPHATLAVWDADDKLTIYNESQVVNGVQGAVASVFGLPNQNVRVITPHIGGGFGSKGGAWGHVVITAIAAKMTKRPVKMALTRQMMFTSVGLRQRNRQHLQIAATKNGKITALAHETTTHCAINEEFLEPCGDGTKVQYDAPNISVTYKVAPMNIILPTYQRAPGKSTGSFALESAIDELAYKLKIDPIEFRLKNEPKQDPFNNKPWSSRYVVEALREGAAKFGWNRRKLEPKQMREGEFLIGYGVACGNYPSRQRDTSAIVKLTKSGAKVAASIELAASDLGTGTRTILTQTAAEILGVPFENVSVKIGDSELPPAAGSVGSVGAASFANAVADACNKITDELIAKSGKQYFVRPTASQLMISENITACETRMDAKPMPTAEDFSAHAFNVNFAEVAVNEATGMTRVRRIVQACDGGRIINPKTAASQIIGGVVWGIGQAISEESLMDPRWGNFVTRSFADYHIPSNLDVPQIETIFVGAADEKINHLGIKGIGEVGIASVAAAIANAVFNATGKRVRDLPITPDKLI